jgi:CRISPR-associated protein Cmr2
MSFDLYVALGGKGQSAVDALVSGRYRGISIPDVAARIHLLAGIAAYKSRIKTYAVAGERGKGGYKSLVYPLSGKESEYVTNTIKPGSKLMDRLGLKKPIAPDMSRLPARSWFLQFSFTLAKPWISRDDDLFYVADSVNPVRKDKVFKVPFMSAVAWKGLLRWTAMRVDLVEEQDPGQFALKRFYHALLFGNEKGEDFRRASGTADYLNEILPEARDLYTCLQRYYYHLDETDPIPHHSGRLMFYPTFFNLIDLEVINPHDRKTKAGTHPIYLECVPAGAKGTFSLLYVPFDCSSQGEEKTLRQAAIALPLVAKAIITMMLVYGFSAKRSSGYGLAEEKVNRGILQVHLGGSQRFECRISSFDGLCKKAEEAAKALLETGGGT